MSSDGPRSRFRRGLRNGAIFSLLTLGLLAALEAGVRLVAPQEVRTEYGPSGPLGRLDPELGYAYAPNTSAAVTGPEFTVRYQINADGMRDPVPHPRPKPPGRTRILALGDSFAFGAGNRIEDTWASILERRLVAAGHDVDVVKAGVSGYDTRTEALYLERLIEPWQPDIVLVAFLPNDLFTNLPVGDRRAARTEAVVATTAGAGRRFSLEVVTLAKRLAMVNDRTYARLYLMTARGDYFRAPPSPRLRQQLEVTAGLLARIRRRAAAAGASLVVVSIPQQFQVLARAGTVPEGVDVEVIDRELGALAERDGATWIRTLDVLAAAYRTGGADLYHRLDGHLDAAGNRILGEYLAGELAPRLRPGSSPAVPPPRPAGPR